LNAATSTFDKLIIAAFSLSFAADAGCSSQFSMVLVELDKVLAMVALSLLIVAVSQEQSSTPYISKQSSIL
jgi:hypothetical protein